VFDTLSSFGWESSQLLSKKVGERICNHKPKRSYDAQRSRCRESKCAKAKFGALISQRLEDKPKPEAEEHNR
jgi:hypothetical protein